MRTTPARPDVAASQGRGYLSAPGFLAALLALLVPTLALSQADRASAGEAYDTPDRWQVEVTPYLWAVRIKGDVHTPPMPLASLDLRFADVLSSLEFGLMGALEARKGRWGLLGDAIYTRNGGSARVAGALDADLRLSQTLLSAGLFRRLTEGSATVDGILGLRYNRMSTDLDLETGQARVSGSRTRDWTDPYLGVRLTVRLGDRWSAVGYVDAGGFGVGSDLTWQGLVGLRYAWSDTLTPTFGYRTMTVDYDDGGFRYDVRNDGLYAGVSLRF